MSSGSAEVETVWLVPSRWVTLPGTDREVLLFGKHRLLREGVDITPHRPGQPVRRIGPLPGDRAVLHPAGAAVTLLPYPCSRSPEPQPD